jgi:penicillin-binding protein 1A
MGVGGFAALMASLTGSLPNIIKIEDYKPLLITSVYARGGEKIGEYFRENRTLVPFEKIPKKLIYAFVAAEDDTFFEHKGINYLANIRAFVVNLTSGEKRQGASTITQQVARSLFLTSEKTYTRKIKEVLLSQKMEDNFTKQEILYLYLNQIYFGEGAYGIAAAADTYFRKTVDKLTLGEIAILAGLPQAPSSYSPTEHPQKAKARQKYVLNRMKAIGQITDDEMQAALKEQIKVYLGKEYKQVAPYFVETLRQLLVNEIGENAVLDDGLRINTSIDYQAQVEANKEVQEGLRYVDKREGYRGATRNITNPDEQKKFLLETRKALMNEYAPVRTITTDGTFAPDKELATFHKKDAKGRIVGNIPDYIKKDQIVEGLVTKVDDTFGLTTVQFAEGIGLIDLADMGWARKPDPSVNPDMAQKIKKPSQALKVGDVILVRVVADKFYSDRLNKEMAPKKHGPAPGKPQGLPDFDDYAYLLLEQKPIVEGALLSFDQKTGEVIAMVGGYEFVRNKSEFNRTVQAKRQTGSAFKTIVYSAALDKGYTPATPIQDAPVVFTSEEQEGQEDANGDAIEAKTWKPHNDEQKFEGDILFRKALIRSLNVPTVKVLEKIGVPYVMDYARRLGVFSPLNADLSLGLGSSSLTLYEMTKVLSNLGRMGKKVTPLVLHSVQDRFGKEIYKELSLDKRFQNEITAVEDEQAKLHAAQPSPTPRPDGTMPPSIFPDDPNQLISPQTAYITTSILEGVISESDGTGIRAKSFGRPAAGKTGSSSGYFDGWFVGYTPQIVTGVWVGFDSEQTLGRGEVGSHTALPIWLGYMKAVHKDLPVEDFSVPPGIVFANIDTQTGNLASASSANVVRQAFKEGTEPASLSGSPSTDDETDFLKKDLSE